MWCEYDRQKREREREGERGREREREIWQFKKSVGEKLVKRNVQHIHVSSFSQGPYENNVSVDIIYCNAGIQSPEIQEHYYRMANEATSVIVMANTRVL